MIRRLLFPLMVLALVACQGDSATDSPAPQTAEPAQPPVVDMHTSRIALDWAGIYEGLLACADCPGLHVRLTLQDDGRFEMSTRRLERGAEPTLASGSFDWEPGDNVIRFDTEQGPQRFAVGEGRLLQMDIGQERPAWGDPGATLAQVASGWAEAGQDLAEILEDHRWTLVDATDAAGQRLDALLPAGVQPFAFHFSDSRLLVEGGCNGLRGAFAVDADGRLAVTGQMSTMMACADELMAADAALSALMAEPLETVMVAGAQPRLLLLAADGDALILSGELKPEARFGEPSVIFLEVAPERVPCESSPRGDGLCLNVREIEFDAQGLRVGAPGEWQTLAVDIEEYWHEPGIRNVLRVRRFDPEAGSDPLQGPLYVLDLVVESEVIDR